MLLTSTLFHLVLFTPFVVASPLKARDTRLRGECYFSPVDVTLKASVAADI